MRSDGADAADDPVLGGHAVVDALLQEQLGGEQAPDLVQRVLAARSNAAGDEAAARLAAAERDAAGGGARTRWFAAALLLLGVGAVVAVAAMRGEGRSDAVPAVQQPQEPQGKEPRSVAVDSVEQLQELLLQTTGMKQSWVRLPFFDLQVPPETPPYRASARIAKLVATQFAHSLRTEAPSTQPGETLCWFQFYLGDDRALLVGLVWDDTLEKQRRARLSVQNLPASVSVGDPEDGLSQEDKQALELAANESLLAAQRSLGVVMPVDLQPGRIDAFRNCESLRVRPGWLFPMLSPIGADELARLAQLPKLRRLDLSGVASYVTRKEVRELAKSTSLRELVLDGCDLDDDDLQPIGQMPNLQALSLSDCGKVQGRAFLQVIDGMTPPGPPFQTLVRLDLSGCTGLQDYVLPNLGALPNLRDLRLADASLADDDKRWIIFREATKVEVLDLSGHALAADRLRRLAELPSLRELILCHCDLDDGDLEILVASKTLQRLCIGDNPVASTVAAMNQIGVLGSERPHSQLRTIDVRSHDQLDGEPQHSEQLPWGPTLLR